jgi:hypothetical protein
VLIFVVLTIAVFGYLDYAARKSRVDLVLLDSRFKLFRVRDRLRMLAIDGKVEHDNWFDYFDTTLTKMIDLLPALTIWQIALLVFHYRKDIMSEKWHADLDAFLAANPEYQSIFSEYARVIGGFLFGRHWVIKAGFNFVARFTFALTEFKRDSAAIVATAPETSTFLQYCEN